MQDNLVRITFALWRTPQGTVPKHTHWWMFPMFFSPPYLYFRSTHHRQDLHEELEVRGMPAGASATQDMAKRPRNMQLGIGRRHACVRTALTASKGGGRRKSAPLTSREGARQVKRLASRLKSAVPEAATAGASQRMCRSGARNEPAIVPCTLLSPSSVAAGSGVACAHTPC